MVAKVSGYETDEDGKPIPQEFGWNLQAESWSVFNKEKPVLEANEAGLKVTGEIVAERGHIGKFIIGDEHECHYLENETDKNASGIHSDGYVQKFDDTPGKEAETVKNDGTKSTYIPKTKGVYIGTDGIKLGENFSVDIEGNMTASGLTLVDQQQQIQTISADTKTKFESLDESIASINTTINTTTDDLNNKIIAIAQGKSTNYYSVEDPAGNATDKHNNTYGTAQSSKKLAIKKGDCWFNSGVSDVDRKSLNTIEDYLGYKIKTNVKCVRDFVPVKCDSNSVYGLFDKIENKFYPSAGVAFAKDGVGPTQSEIFKDHAGNAYTSVLYITSTENNQYIDTGINPYDLNNKKFTA
jgi:hypothetical protein